MGHLRAKLQIQSPWKNEENKVKSQIFKTISESVMQFEFREGGGIEVTKNGNPQV
jgi:hypothetical protein